ncbi:hypothetical protein CCACVL1_25691 [Corchorus capsularis]|uniref:Uncharacterized protein n=1 Tax=Corchorus capsularis TaxID=210143 RepID=A0A1R3GI57_COCAP|nr:hypothetical protein CCACVL1_25691 [Corchorus capsularis]
MTHPIRDFEGKEKRKEILESLAMRIQLTAWEQEDGMGLGRNSKAVK